MLRRTVSPNYSRILELSARKLGISVETIRGRGRTQTVSDRRAVVAWVLSQKGMSLSEVGIEIGRDHATVAHLINKVSNTPDLLEEAVLIASEL